MVFQCTALEKKGGQLSTTTPTMQDEEKAYHAESSSSGERERSRYCTQHSRVSGHCLGEKEREVYGSQPGSVRMRGRAFPETFFQRRRDCRVCIQCPTLSLNSFKEKERLLWWLPQQCEIER